MKNLKIHRETPDHFLTQDQTRPWVLKCHRQSVKRVRRDPVGVLQIPAVAQELFQAAAAAASAQHVRRCPVMVVVVGVVVVVQAAGTDRLDQLLAAAA